MKQAMVFAAGLGTRLRPLTNDRPKAMVEIEGQTLLEITLRKLKRAGFQRVVVNVHHFAELVKSFLKTQQGFGLDLIISDESDLLLETGGGFAKALDYFTAGPVLIHNVDILSSIDLDELWEQHLRTQTLATLAVRQRQSSRYLLFDEQGYLRGWRNVKTGEEKWCNEVHLDAKHLAFSGIHVVNTNLWQYYPTQEKVFSIIDAYLAAGKEQAIQAYQHDEDLWLDVGKPEALAKASQIIGQLD